MRRHRVLPIDASSQPSSAVRQTDSTVRSHTARLKFPSDWLCRDNGGKARKCRDDKESLRQEDMAKPILDDELWALIQLLPPPPKPRRSRCPGRKPLGDRAVLTGIPFVPQSGIPWEMLPQEMGCGSGMSCWRRLREWQQAGVWDRLREILRARLLAADRIGWSRISVDSSSIRAVRSGKKTGPNPPGRARPGSKHHLVTEGVSLVDPTERMPVLIRLGQGVHETQLALPNSAPATTLSRTPVFWESMCVRWRSAADARAAPNARRRAACAAAASW